MRRTKKGGIFFALFLLLITTAYGLFQARILIEGPVMTILSPPSGATITSTLFEIKGETEHVTHVYINNRPILLDTKGTFSEKLVTPHGYAIMDIRAQDRFGHSIKRQIKFFGNPRQNKI